MDACPVFTLTGLASWVGDASPQPWWVNLCYGFHVGLGLCTDLLVLLHIYLKYLKSAVGFWADLIRSWRQGQDLNYSLLHDPGGNISGPWQAAKHDQGGGA